jgi:hypothetical protein
MLYIIGIILSLISQASCQESDDLQPLERTSSGQMAPSSDMPVRIISEAHFSYEEIRREIVDGNAVATQTTGQETLRLIQPEGAILTLTCSESAQEDHRYFMHALLSKMDHPVLKMLLPNYLKLPDAVNGVIILVQRGEGGSVRIRKYKADEFVLALQRVSDTGNTFLKEFEEREDKQYCASLMSSSGAAATDESVLRVSFPYQEIITTSDGHQRSVLKEGCDWFLISRSLDPQSEIQRINFSNMDKIPQNIARAFLDRVATRTGEKAYSQLLRGDASGLPSVSRGYYILTNNDPIAGQTQRFYKAAQLNASIEFGVCRVLQEVETIKKHPNDLMHRKK